MNNRIDDILALIDGVLDDNRFDYDDECRLEDDEAEAYDDDPTAGFMYPQDGKW